MASLGDKRILKQENSAFFLLLGTEHFADDLENYIADTVANAKL